MIKFRNAKPQFFQLLVPGFESHFSIPKSFLKYLGGEKYEKNNKVLLRDNSGRSWEVKVDNDNNKLHFKDGWNNFCYQNGLKVGDFLVFRHSPSWDFDVLIFDPTTACERHFSHFESPSQIQVKGSPKKEVKEGQPQKVKFEPSVKHPYCHLVVRHYSLRSSQMHLPLKFARENELDRNCNVTLLDNKGRPWSMKIGVSNRTTPYIKGWADFQRGNNLKPGDQLILELIHSGTNPLLKLHF